MEAKEFTQEILRKSFFNEEQIALIMDVDQTTVSSWKTGRRNITTGEFLKLIDILGYTRKDFLDGRIESSIKTGFKAKSINKIEDLKLISRMNKLFANIIYMSNFKK